jgi:hypothetical protein
MSLTIHQATIPVFVRMLGQLSRILAKGAAHAEAMEIEPAVLLESRLHADMYPLLKQAQIATDAAVDAAARLAQVDPPAFADDERSFAELEARIRRVVAFLESIDPARFEGAGERTVSWTARGTTISVKGATYLLDHAMPKFYFHVTTAYAILRHDGVPLRKGDFMGKV